MLAFLPGTQEIADLFITIIITVVGGGWAGGWFFLKRREQSFLMEERRAERRAGEVKEIRQMNMAEEEHNARIELIKELAANNKLELTSDGKFRQKS